MVWGGKIIDVRNLTETTEVEVVAYPLDGAQRPDQNAPTLGTFHRRDSGLRRTVRLSRRPFRDVARTHRRHARDAASTSTMSSFPLVADATVHMWPVNFPYEQPRVHFSLGVGVGIH